MLNYVRVRARVIVGGVRIIYFPAPTNERFFRHVRPESAATGSFPLVARGQTNHDAFRTLRKRYVRVVAATRYVPKSHSRRFRVQMPRSSRCGRRIARSSFALRPSANISRFRFPTEFDMPSSSAFSSARDEAILDTRSEPPESTWYAYNPPDPNRLRLPTYPHARTNYRVDIIDWF